MEWAAFEKVFGPLTVQERVTVAGATATWAPLAAAGGKAGPEEFLPAWGARSREQQSPEDMIAVMRTIKEGTSDDQS